MDAEKKDDGAMALDLEAGRPAEESKSSLPEQPGQVDTPDQGAGNDEESQDNSDAASIGNQQKLLSKSRLLVAFPALSIALFVSFIDQTSVSTSIPAVSAELNTGSSTSWIGASFLIAATAFQLMNGRISDIFGRKNCLLFCLFLLAVGDILSGFARTKEQLFAFRAIAGIWGGGINSLAMIIVSDITSYQNRGKYMGACSTLPLSLGIVYCSTSLRPSAPDLQQVSSVLWSPRPTA